MAGVVRTLSLIARPLDDAGSTGDRAEAAGRDRP
jgi:hypothetical protein